jgi:hypothetical protein
LQIEDTQAPAADAVKTIKVPYLELTSDVILSRRGRHGEPKIVTLRLVKGTRVPIVRVIQNKNERFPFVCVWQGWPHFFNIGRGHTILLIEEAADEDILAAMGEGETQVSEAVCISEE